MTSTRLDVQWQVRNSQPEPLGWFQWTPALYRRVVGRLKAPADQHLGVESLAVRRLLGHALELGLGRYTGWDLTKLDQLQREHCEVAATYFKRGVAVRTDLDAAPYQARAGAACSNSSGQYPVVFHDSVEAPTLQWDPQQFTVVDYNVMRAWPYLGDLADAWIKDLSETSKTVESVALLIRKWKDHRQRCGGRSDAPWVVVGGGVLLDLASLAAAMVGAEVIALPTTLLSMVDASVGGKTGANAPPYGKNQVGCFAFPKSVHIWLPWLETLADRHMVGGGAECLKHGFLMGKRTLCRRVAANLSKRDPSRMVDDLQELVRFKVDVVGEDPFDEGRRAVLNYGHTLAHALEAVSQERCHWQEVISHGEAVGLGMHFANLLAYEEGHLAEDDVLFMKDILQSAGCLISRPELRSFLGADRLAASATWDAIERMIRLDKKQGLEMAAAKEAGWVLLSKLGRVCGGSNEPVKYLTNVPFAAAKRCWRAMVGSDWHR